MSIFGSEKIIKLQQKEQDLNIYYAGFDLGNFRYKELIEQLQRVIVDFAYGFHDGILEDSYNIDILRESAKSLYTIKEFQDVKKIYIDDNSEIGDDIKDKFLKRGEFGELILHLLLRDFHDALPLLSKIYLKDSYGHTVHGFDSVHIAPDINDSSKYSLWFGESKLYTDGKTGVKALTKDIEDHFNADYLRSEFALISKKKESFIALDKFKDANRQRKYEEFLKLKDEWYKKLDTTNKLEDILSSVTIPMLCTYSSETFNKHTDETTKEFLKELYEEVEGIKKHFDDNLKIPIPVSLNIILFLFPVPSKKELVKQLHTKLSYMQAM
jgi:hypothetical protein